jgi:uncharacterized protein YndB with AHSA1/START domain
MQPITIQTIIQKPIETVWEKWTNPSDVMQWNHTSDDWYCPSATNDLRVGGEFHFIMAAKDKSFEFDFNGIYTEIILFEKIAYTMQAVPDMQVDGDRKAVIVFEKISETETRVTETFDPETENPIEMQRSGWQAILDNFKSFCEKT